MGKGEIIGGGEDGLYQVRLIYNRTRLDSTLSELVCKISEQEAKILLLPEGLNLDRAYLILVALEKEKERYDAIPQDPETSAWLSLIHISEPTRPY